MNYKNAKKVDHPSHYKHRSGYDAIEWIDRYAMFFSEGCIFKYLFRRGLKDGESIGDDEEKAKWYFRHQSELWFKANPSLAWNEAKEKASVKLMVAFGPPEKNEDGTPDWTRGGCDMPSAIEFIQKLIDDPNF